MQRELVCVYRSCFSFSVSAEQRKELRREEEKGSLKPEVLVGQLSPQQWVWDRPSWPPGRTVGGQVSFGEPAVDSRVRGRCGFGGGCEDMKT